MRNGLEPGGSREWWPLLLTMCRSSNFWWLQIRLNEACRRLGKPFYAGGTYGVLGYIFCDLLKHDYVAP